MTTQTTSAANINPSDLRLKIPKFKSAEQDISVRSWVKAFEALTKNKTDAEQIEELMQYLDGPAFEWYCDEILNSRVTLWDTCKNRLITRFGSTTSTPLLDAAQMSKKFGQSIEEYYRTKMRLLKQTHLNNKEQAQMLTSGLPASWRPLLTSCQVQTPNDWIGIALELEHDFKAAESKKFNKPQKPFFKKKSPVNMAVGTSQQTQQKPKPSYPCRFCKALNIEVWHWHSDCPNRSNSSKKPNRSPTDTNTVTTQQDSSADVMPSNALSDHSQIAELINVDVKINNKAITGFVDSGSKITILGEKESKALHLKLIPNSKIAIQTISGVTHTLGQAEVQLTIGQITRRVKLHVMANFRYQLLIGLDIGRPFGLTIYLSNSSVSVPPSIKSEQQYICLNVTSTDPQITQMLNKYSDVFAKDESDIGRITAVKHKIITRPHPPIQMRHYRRPQSEYDKINAIVKDLEEKGLIRKSQSPWAFPVVLAYRKDSNEKDRFCNDYRHLNQITIDDKMPLPRIDDIIDRFRKAKYYTSLDVKWGYWHIEMDPDSVEKTAFITNEGHYEWLVMPFGLKNAPATFQRIIQHILSERLYKGVLNYLDDIMIYSETVKEHLETLEFVFNKMRENNIKLKMSKCKFMQTEVEFLGHVIGHNYVKPSPRLVESVSKFPIPTNVRKIREFLGLTSYMRRFIKGYAQIAKPLYKLLEKDTLFHWDTDQQQAFETLIAALTSKPILAIFDPTKSCILYTDASGVGIGAILAQVGEDGREHPIGYYSKTLKKHQQSYHVTDLEGLAVVMSLEHFDCYLHELPFTLITDHSALQYILQNKNPNKRQFNWSLYISTFNVYIKHRSGKLITHVDALSRNPVDHHLTVPQLIQMQTNQDLSYIGQTVVRNGVQTTRVNKRYLAIIPTNSVKTLLENMHDQSGHPGINRTVREITAHYYWPNCRKDIKEYVRSCKTCQLVKQPRSPFLGQYIAPEADIKPKDIFGIDTIVIGPAANDSKYKYIQVIIDHHSRHVWAFPSINNTAATIVNILQSLFLCGAKPKALLMDCAQNFQSRVLKNFCENHGIKRIFATPYHPQTCGMVERINGTIIEKLRVELKDHPRRKWSTLLTDVVKNYNNSIHDITGFTPNYLFYGQDNSPDIGNQIIPLEQARQLACERTRVHQIKRKQRHDDKHRQYDFPIGSKVLRKIASNHPSLTKFHQRWTGPYLVIRQTGPVSYEIAETLTENPIRAHVSQLKPFFAREESPPPDGNVTV